MPAVATPHMGASVHLCTQLPIALGMMSPGYDTPAARAMVLAIALQETSCNARTQQPRGPARSFWQFEPIGIEDLFLSNHTRDELEIACLRLCIPHNVDAVYQAITYNDVLAIVCARAKLARLPDPLPTRHNPQSGWHQYQELWRPGIPRGVHWPANFARAWEIIDPL